MWKTFKQQFQDLESPLYDQKERVDYHIRIACEPEAHKERQLAILYRRQGVEHRLLEIQQWALEKDWNIQQSKLAESMFT